MRNIGHFEKESLAKRFSLYLKKMGIENNYETNKEIFEIWVFNEDEMMAAKICLEEFEKNPNDPKFEISVEDIVKDTIEKEDFQPIVLKKKKKNKLTLITLFICSLIYGMNLFQFMSMDKKEILTPIEKLLFYDAPQKENPFLGFYNILMVKLQGDSLPIGDMFVKIRDGEIWRVLSPAFLHRDFLHLLFNVLWLWMLGRQIEERISFGRYLSLILILAVVSNTFQYLMAGPYFLGYSGVVLGMAGFIWARQKKAPWEGYPLQKAVLYFLFIFILVTLLLQVISFFMQIAGFSFSLGILANTAHISGFITGALLGQLAFFKWRKE